MYFLQDYIMNSSTVCVTDPINHTHAAQFYVESSYRFES